MCKGHYFRPEVFLRVSLIVLVVTMTTEGRHIRANVTQDHRTSHRPTHRRPGLGLRIQPVRYIPATTEAPTQEQKHIIPVIYDDSHCMNGGTGYLGTFCLCPPYYTGRFCETDLLNDTTCGELSHGDWVYRDCTLCRCDDGLLICELFELEGCRERAARSNTGTHKTAPTFWLTIVLLTSVTTLILRCYDDTSFR